MVAGQLRLLDSVKLDQLRPLELIPILTGRLVHATSDSESSRPGGQPATRFKSLSKMLRRVQNEMFTFEFDSEAVILVSTLERWKGTLFSIPLPKT